MKQQIPRRLPSIAALLLLAAATVVVAEQADRVLRKGEWELQIVYRNKGTRSEGQHGTLLRSGQVIKGEKVGQELETDFGTLKYFGETAEALWLPTGWNFTNAHTIPRSWHTNRLEFETNNGG